MHDLAKSHYFSSDRLQYNCKQKVVEAAIIIFLNYEIFSNNIYHLFTETEGNSVFCGPETVDVSRGEAEGNIDGRGFTKHTAFPRSQQISVLLYINSRRNNKLKNK